jgi:hypothetical protein
VIFCQKSLFNARVSTTIVAMVVPYELVTSSSSESLSLSVVEREKGLVKLFLGEFILRTGRDQILFTKFGKIDLVI